MEKYRKDSTPSFPDQANWSLSLSNLRICNCLTICSPVVKPKCGSAISLSFMVPSKPRSSFPISKRASATKAGRQWWYSHKRRWELSASKVDLVARATSPDGWKASCCWEYPTITWNSGTRFLISRSRSSRLLNHWPSSSSSRKRSTSRNTRNTSVYFPRHLASASAVQCWTNGDGDWRPFDMLFFALTEGKTFSNIADNGGGDGW